MDNDDLWLLDDADDDPWKHIPHGMWHPKQGPVIAICDMTDSHLSNTIAWLVRWGDTSSSKYHELVREHEARLAGGEYDAKA